MPRRALRCGCGEPLGEEDGDTLWFAAGALAEIDLPRRRVGLVCPACAARCRRSYRRVVEAPPRARAVGRGLRLVD